MYAIVKAGGRQEKVAVGDTVIVDRIDAKTGAAVSFPALLVVEGETVTSDAKALAGVLSRVKVVTTSGKEVNLEELAPKQAAAPAAE